MSRRGPEQSGFWYTPSESMGLAHNRLSIIDLHERANEPMQYLNGRYVMTYNGEVYNYKQLKQALIKKNYSFVTDSDAEVVMAMYDCYGAAMLTMLRGMFAFAIWDNDRRRLFAARDCFGIKPFYYYHDTSSFIFASQVKALSENIECKLTASAPGWCGFVRHGSVPEPYTIYNEIKNLPAGHYLEIGEQDNLAIHPYFSIYDEFANIESTTNTKVEYAQVDQAFSDSISHHLVADVPVGLFLSSGIDSTVLASYLAEKRDKPVAFTLDFQDFDSQHNESRLATESARHYRLAHKVLEINLDSDQEFLDSFFMAMDQPSIDGLNVWLISRIVAAEGYKAVMSGLGADEILAGYPSFKDVPKYARLVTLAGRMSKAGIPLDRIMNLDVFKRYTHPKLRGFFNDHKDPFLSAYHIKRSLFLENEIKHFFSDDFIKSGLQALRHDDMALAINLNKIDNPYLRVAALEIDNYMKNQLLRDADWASMSHSLELRVPFVDWPLIKACACELVKLANPSKRAVVRETLKGRLPEAILMKEKTGFTTPINKWLYTEPSLQSWRNNAEFARINYPWARRWAYEVSNRFMD